MPPSSLVIAVDGPAGSGKGTIAGGLARHYGLRHLDTGLLYRACAEEALRRCASPADPAALIAVGRRAARRLAATPLDALGATLENLDLRRPDIASAASIVAADAALRRILIAVQRQFAAAPPGAVLDGRDIGSVILPDADVKFFVTADLEVRAHRRLADYRAAGIEMSSAKARSDLEKRDRRDAQRDVAPLRKGQGFHLLDTSQSDIRQTLSEAVRIADSVRSSAATAPSARPR